MSDKVCMFDMDDTLYDYVGQLRRDLEALQSPHEPPLPENLFRDTPAWLRRRMNLIKSQPGWWLNLPRLQLGWIRRGARARGCVIRRMSNCSWAMCPILTRAGNK